MDPLSKTLQRYCFAYTAVHDFSVADQVMAEDYTFYMGEHVFTGREDAYKPAADRQFRAYPGLGFAVHDFFSNGDRCAMFFSEFGHSAQYDTDAAWQGVSLYRWNGEVLTECRIEQDYYGRRRQLESKVPEPAPAPAFAPWTAPVHPANPETEQAAKAWLENGGLLRSGIGCLDDERIAPTVDRVIFDQERTTIVDMLSAGDRVAFQLKIDGVYAGGLPTLAGHEGTQASLYVTGIATVTDGRIGGVRAITDRYTMERRILSAAKKAAAAG